MKTIIHRCLSRFHRANLYRAIGFYLLALVAALASPARGAEEAVPPEIAAEEATAYAAGDAYVAKVHATIRALKAQVEDQSLLVAELEALRQQVITLQAQVLQLQQERDDALAAQGAIANATLTQAQTALPQAIVAELEKLKTP